MLGGGDPPGKRWRLVFTSNAKQVQAAIKEPGAGGGIYFPVAGERAGQVRAGRAGARLCDRAAGGLQGIGGAQRMMVACRCCHMDTLARLPVNPLAPAPPRAPPSPAMQPASSMMPAPATTPTACTLAASPPSRLAAATACRPRQAQGGCDGGAGQRGLGGATALCRVEPGGCTGGGRRADAGPARPRAPVPCPPNHRSWPSLSTRSRCAWGGGRRPSLSSQKSTPGVQGPPDLCCRQGGWRAAPASQLLAQAPPRHCRCRAPAAPLAAAPHAAGAPRRRRALQRVHAQQGGPVFCDVSHGRRRHLRARPRRRRRAVGAHDAAVGAGGGRGVRGLAARPREPLCVAAAHSCMPPAGRR